MEYGKPCPLLASVPLPSVECSGLVNGSFSKPSFQFGVQGLAECSEGVFSAHARVVVSHHTFRYPNTEKPGKEICTTGSISVEQAEQDPVFVYMELLYIGRLLQRRNIIDLHNFIIQK